MHKAGLCSSFPATASPKSLNPLPGCWAQPQAPVCCPQSLHRDPALLPKGVLWCFPCWRRILGWMRALQGLGRGERWVRKSQGKAVPQPWESEGSSAPLRGNHWDTQARARFCPPNWATPTSLSLSLTSCRVCATRMGLGGLNPPKPRFWGAAALFPYPPAPTASLTDNFTNHSLQIICKSSALSQKWHLGARSPH